MAYENLQRNIYSVSQVSTHLLRPGVMILASYHHLDSTMILNYGSQVGLVHSEGAGNSYFKQIFLLFKCEEVIWTQKETQLSELFSVLIKRGGGGEESESDSISTETQLLI